MIAKTILLSLMLTTVAHASTVYKCEAPSGGITYSDKPCVDNTKESLLEIKQQSKKQQQASKTKKVLNTRINKLPTKKKKYSAKQLDIKCNELAKIIMMDPAGLSSPEYQEFQSIGCGAASRMR